MYPNLWQRRHPLVIAHRGAAGSYPENTLVSFSAALEMGADGVECDVQISADGVPVVIHDPTLERTTNGKGAVSELTLDEIRKLDAGRGEKVPTLDEVLDLCSGKAILTIEFKSIEGVEPTLKLLENSGSDFLILCSFIPDALIACAEKRPDISALLITGSLSFNPFVRWREAFPRRTLKKVRARGLSCHHRMVSPARVRRIRRSGYDLVLWSTPWEEQDSTEWFRKATRADPDALATIWPDRLLEFLGRENKKKEPPHE